MRRNSEHILSEWLVLNAQSGKAAAMEQLLRLWYPKFLRYSQHQLRSKEAAKDVVQETLLTISRKIGRVKDPIAFPRWAYQILHRRGVDYQRGEIARRARENKSVETLDAIVEPDIEFDTQQRVGAALSELGELSYNVVHLHYLHGLSLKEISVICRIPEGTVKSRLHNARGQLKKLLAD